MTLEAFLKALEQTPRTWRLWTDDPHNGWLRDACGNCPIEAVAMRSGHGHFGGTLWKGRLLGIDRADACSIMGGADYENVNKPLRARLLLACGLSSPETEGKVG